MIEQHRWVVIAAIIWIVSGPRIGTARADDVQVNTYTSGNQGNPSVALDADGDFVVVWESYGSGGTDSSSYSIQGQRYASDGSTLGGEFQVNTHTTGAQICPSVALDADGDFVVAWQSSDIHRLCSQPLTGSASIQGQRYASDGSTVRDQFQVNTYPVGGRPSVALDADSDFVVVWESFGSGGTDSSGLSVQGQRYASDGSTVGGQFQVNTYTTDNQRSPSVVLDADGDFVVVWHGQIQGLGINGQLYASDGSTVGGEFEVNGEGHRPSVALDAAGDFVVVWEDRSDSSSYTIHGQLYASDGSTVGGQFQVSTSTYHSRFSTVAMDADGDFVVVWTNGIASQGGEEIQGQRYASDGSTVGGEFQINTYTTSDQESSRESRSVSIDDAGNFVVVWQSDGSGGTDTDGNSVQRTPVELIFADGFESGDTSVWS